MAYFYCRLQPPRPSFPFDITSDEEAAMAEHARYWQALAAKGAALLAGPVFDPAGAFGIVIAAGPDAEAVERMTSADPVVTAGLGFGYSLHPMPSIILGTALAAPSSH